MSNKIVRRGYVDTDQRDFSPTNLETLQKAQQEIHWLLDRGYPLKNTLTFVGNADKRHGQHNKRFSRAARDVQANR